MPIRVYEEGAQMGYKEDAHIKDFLVASRIPQKNTLENYRDLCLKLESPRDSDNPNVQELVVKSLKAAIATYTCCFDENHKNDERLFLAKSIFDSLSNNAEIFHDPNNKERKPLEEVGKKATQAYRDMEEGNYSYKNKDIEELSRCAQIVYNALKGSANTSTNSFVSDYNRIVFSSSFRRLQDKAQVFSLEEHDYARTRLTHSIEVSSIASQIAGLCAIKLQKGSTKYSFPMEKILACAALLHDIGNPPFGHYGEDIIKKFFGDNWKKFKYTQFSSQTKGKTVKIQSAPIDDKKVSESNKNDYKKQFKMLAKDDFIKFDGNAQSLRIASKLQLYKPGHSLELTAAVLGAIIKYPVNSLSALNDKFGYFYSEQDIINDLTAFGTYQENYRNPFVYLLEAADDISYVTSDFDDVVKKQVVSYEKFQHELQCMDKNFERSEKNIPLFEFKNDFERFYNENKNTSVDSPFALTIQRMTNDLRRKLVDEVVEAFDKNSESIIKGICLKNEFELLKNIPSAPLIEWIKKYIFKKYVYSDNEIIKNELVGDEILTYLLDKFCEAILHLNFCRDAKGNFYLYPLDQKNEFAKDVKIFLLISSNFIDQFKTETADIDVNSLNHIYYRFRLIVDYISGMTDTYAKEVYQVLRGIK